MRSEKRLFLSCMVALVATAVGFICRNMVIGDIGVELNLTETQKGAILGAGLYPFALSIVFFSLVVDRMGYGRAMALGWILHVISGLLVMTAKGYPMLYLGTALFSLANGTVEAVINPVTATLFPKDKTHYLTVLHAGWPGGMVLGGLAAIALGPTVGWRLKIGLYLLVVLVYGLLLLGQKFPLQERVQAGVPYREMLAEFGWAGCLISSLLVAYALDEVVRVFGYQLSGAVKALIAIVPTVLCAVWLRSFGRPLFVLLLLSMLPLATQELGTDSWITDLMVPVLKAQGRHAGEWVVIVTSVVMFVLRFFAGPLVHRVTQLGLLAGSAAVACIGLVLLSAAGSMPWLIFLAAAVYACGKTFLWPTTLGVASEQFPRGGALTLNAISAVGLISVGVIGNPLLGVLQDRSLDQRLQQQNPALHQQVAAPIETKFGFRYSPLDKARIAATSPASQAQIDRIVTETKQRVLGKVAMLPAGLFVFYLGLAAYFRLRGGYRPVVLRPEAQVLVPQPEHSR